MTGKPARKPNVRTIRRKAMEQLGSGGGAAILSVKQMSALYGTNLETRPQGRPTLHYDTIEAAWSFARTYLRWVRAILKARTSELSTVEDIEKVIQSQQQRGAKLPPEPLSLGSFRPKRVLWNPQAITRERLIALVLEDVQRYEGGKGSEHISPAAVADRVARYAINQGLPPEMRIPIQPHPEDRPLRVLRFLAERQARRRVGVTVDTSASREPKDIKEAAFTAWMALGFKPEDFR